MKSAHLVDPELRQLIETFPFMDFSNEGLEAIRAIPLAFPVKETGALGTVVEDFLVPGPSGAPSVRVVSYRPAQSTGILPAILHMHAGGYVTGSVALNDAENRLLARELNCAIFSVEYRLAPETPHPGPLEDCYAALRWLEEQAGALLVDVTRIGLKGESAGGGKAAALALLARDRGGPHLAFQHLNAPMIDDRDEAPHPYAGEYIWTPSDDRFGWNALLGGGDPNALPYAAAARETDLAGLPPTFISVGALELFLEENMEYARRLTRAGVPVELHVYPGAFHGFQMAAEARVTRAANRDSVEALRRALHG